MAHGLTLIAETLSVNGPVRDSQCHRQHDGVYESGINQACPTKNGSEVLEGELLGDTEDRLWGLSRVDYKFW